MDTVNYFVTNDLHFNIMIAHKFGMALSISGQKHLLKYSSTCFAEDSKRKLKFAMKEYLKYLG